MPEFRFQTVRSLTRKYAGASAPFSCPTYVLWRIATRAGITLYEDDGKGRERARVGD